MGFNWEVKRVVRGDRERDRPNQRSLEKIEKAKRGSQKPRPCAHELAGRRKQTCRPTTVAGRAAKYRTRWVMGRGHFRRTPPSARFSAGRHWPVPLPRAGGSPTTRTACGGVPGYDGQGPDTGGPGRPAPPSGISPENPRLVARGPLRGRTPGKGPGRPGTEGPGAMPRPSVDEPRPALGERSATRALGRPPAECRACYTT